MPQNVEAHSQLASSYDSLGQTQAAISAYDATLQLQPDHQLARERLQALRGSA